MTRLLRFTALLLLCLPVLAAVPAVTDAEKAACEIVADYLARGPGAVEERLARPSALASLERTPKLAEIEARFGPRNGTRWELRTVDRTFAEHGAVFHVMFASGVEDVIVLDLSRAGDKWAVKEIRTLAELPSAQRASRATTPTSTAVAKPAASDHWFDSHVLLLLFIAPLLAIASAVLRRHQLHFSSTLLVLALICFAIPVSTLLDPEWPARVRARFDTEPAAVAARREGPLPFARMRSLVAARNALATGEKFDPNRVRDEEAKLIARIWSAAAADLTPAEAQRELDRLPEAAQNPMVMLLRARAALAAGRNEAASKQYAALHVVEPRHDAFWAEEWLAENERRLTPLAKIESRDASVYYSRFFERIAARSESGARVAFQEAWRVQPLTREAIVSGVFGFLRRDPAFALLLNLNQPDERKSADVELARSPMSVPKGALSSATGMFVRIIIGPNVLDLPGGASIAPSDTTVISARDFERQEQQAAMKAVESYESPALASASMQRTIEGAVEVLTEHNRWDRIIALTDSITPDSENVPVSLVTARAKALIRANRAPEARGLVAGRGIMRALQRTPDAAALLQISELLASTGAWDEAMEMVKKSSAIEGAPDVSSTIRRLELRRQLAISPAIRTTPHFEIHATPDVPVTVAERIGDILEAELTRLSTRFRLAAFRSMRVNVVNWKTFSDDVTGSQHVVGIYDGEITIPFAEVASFRDDVVSILTHELTHAIVAQASNDNAPHWFQEGIASRMELVERQENIFQLRPAQQFIALELIDATLLGSIDVTAVGDAYLIAQTFMHFLEDVYGTDAPNRMIDAFRNGSSTDDALVAVAGKNITEVDREFRNWGLTHAGPFLDHTPWPYSQFYSLGIDPKVRDSIRFSRRPTPQTPGTAAPLAPAPRP